jgi:hypothetical protein
VTFLRNEFHGSLLVTKLCIYVNLLKGREHWKTKALWEGNITVDVREAVWDVDWILLAQDKDEWRVLVHTVMNHRVPQEAGNFLTSCVTISFSRMTLHHGVSHVSYLKITFKS